MNVYNQRGKPLICSDCHRIITVEQECGELPSAWCGCVELKADKGEVLRAFSELTGEKR